MNDGWVKVYRKVQDNWLWHKGPFSYGQAWIDLILMANRKEGFIFVRGVQIPIQRGQVGMSVLSLSSRWMWSRKAVETFLNRLEIAQQIAQQKNRISSVITILNYEEYQSTAQQIEHQESNSGATGEQQERTNKKGKEGKKESLEAGIDQVKPSRPTRAAKMGDEEWLKSLKSNPAYEGINIEVLHGKMIAWCEVKGKKPTRARLLNWLNREERPMVGKPALLSADEVRRSNHASAREFVDAAERGEFS